MNKRFVYDFFGVVIFSVIVYFVVDYENIFKPLLLDCLNGGVADGDKCVCLPAFKGEQCEQNACLYGGYPVLGGGENGGSVLLHKRLEPRYHCECTGAFWGGDCSICKKIGYLPGTYVCDLNAPCQNDWYGQKCNVFCDRKKTCNGHGVCQEDGDCICDQGYWSPTSDTQCSTACAKGPNNEICSDHGECKNGECRCYAFGNRSASVAYVGKTCEKRVQ